MTARTPIYLDNAATTPVLDSVAREMVRVMQDDFGNPSSRHAVGLNAERLLRGARQTIAVRLGVDPSAVLFGSGGTEANAMAIIGAAERARREQRHVLVSAVEHPSVLGSAALLERRGFEVQQVPVTRGGWVDPLVVAERVRESTLLVAVMHVNNETGIVQPVVEIAHEVKRRNPHALMLVDAVQSFPVLPVMPSTLGADLLSLSAHKVHGPKGVGCLVRGPGVNVAPLWGGGDQESSLRPGTENVAGIVGFARAVQALSPDPARLTRLCAQLEDAFRSARPRAYAVGDADRRAPHILAMAVPGVPSDVLTNAMEGLGVCASSGSACHGRRGLRSHVATAMGLPPKHGFLRLSLSETNTDEEIQRACVLITEALEQL